MNEMMKKNAPQSQANKLFTDERLDQLLSQVPSKDAQSLLGETGLAGQLKERLAERRLEAELSPSCKATERARGNRQSP